MTDVRKSFADLTAAIEDLHGIAVEGQAPSLSSDIQLCLLGSIDAGLTAMTQLVSRMTNAVSERKP